MITETDSQLWDEKLASQWGFGDVSLGFAETGMGMDDNVLASLQFPRKEVLIDYAQRAFALLRKMIWGCQRQPSCLTLVEANRASPRLEEESRLSVLSPSKNKRIKCTLI